MSHPNSPNDPCEWHVLLRGERLGPLSREALRGLLETHQDGWQASVWRLGMLDWRAAATVSALTAEAPASEPPLVSTSAPLADPTPASSVAARNTAGELRVLSYGMAKEPAPEPRAAVAPTSPTVLTLDRSSEWDAVGTSELSAINPSELHALSARESETSEWDAVGTSELRAIGTSELRVLVTRQPSAPATVSELRAVTIPEALRESVLPTMIVSGETSTELPSFSWRSEPDAPSPPAPAPARETVTPTPRGLPVYKPLPATRPPSRAPLFVMGGLVLLSALGLGTALTLRWLRARPPSTSHERAYARAPLPPQQHEPTPDPVASSAMLALPVGEALPALDPSSDASARDTTLAEPNRPGATHTTKRSRAAERGANTRGASRVHNVRVSVASAKVRAGNDPEAQVVCSLPQGSVRPVLTEMPRMGARWFAVRCDAQAVGWVHENDLSPLDH